MSRFGRLMLGTAVSLALAGCGRPAWMDPAKASAKVQQPFVLAGPPGSAPPSAIPPGVSRSPNTSPPPPAWAAAMIGQRMDAVFPTKGACQGNTDNVVLRYDGATPGLKLLGWGWDPATKHRIDRVLLVDSGYHIVGAGEGGVARPDVTAQIAGVTDGEAGWYAVVPRVAGAIDAYGVLPSGGAICQLGHIQL